ncbi:MAG TPA: hypothetical protein VF411_10850 [Bacteroidia bacterium]
MFRTCRLTVGDFYFHRDTHYHNTQDCSAGISQLLVNNNQVTVYPNPNNGSFIIEPNNTPLAGGN